ncbi:ABC transporter permease [Pseudodesulfovibrio nedwellii]|uniref:ABC transporter permease n=1 Tax=Pseudodesulfovibrio nedwellii TaxID=2973072 RepID=A0ABM8B3G9_9BACT|nr:DMT family transporter [Pseudodesulfovibrio nedwellii]BDQ38349.1 ABC transporter permease [Pseudodesulfovibrio nedwellii]
MTPRGIQSMTLTEWLMLITLSIIWGGGFFFNEIALRELPPMLVVFGRISIGSLGLIAVVFITRQNARVHLHRWRQLAVLGTFNTALPFFLIVWGQQYIESGLAAVINATTPAFTILVAHFFTADERFSMRKLSGAALGLGGVATLIGTDALMGFGDHVFGQIAIMGAALSYACAATYARRLTGMSPTVMGCLQLSAASLVMAPVVLVVTRPWELPMPGLETLAAITGLGLLCSTIASLIFFRILTSAGATNISLVTLLIPFSASTLGISFLGEPFTMRLIIGMLIVSAAAILIDGRLTLRRRPPAAQEPFEKGS